MGTGFCMIPKCEEEQKKKARFCVIHQRHYDNMRNAAEHNPVNGSVENRKAFVQKMADTQVAVREIEKHAQENAAIAKWSTSNKQHLIANWTEASGSRTKDEQGMCCIM